jgi:ABC-type nitrate/sulfonate/bicarbonate transport system ATPase subunit
VNADAPGGADVTVEGLRLRWPGAQTAVFDGFDLTVEAGSFVSIVGPSGCGKSTLLRVLAGLVVPSAGHVRVGGHDVIGRPGHCAWMPQRDALLPWRRVLDNAVLGAEVAGLDRRSATGHARDLLDRFGLAEVADAWPHELSGGMRQRVAVLRAVLTPAPVLGLDEPFGALDALTRRQLQSWAGAVLASTQDDGGRRTAILVTHDVEEAVLLADRVVVLSAAPARVVDDVAVDLPRPRDPAKVLDADFVALRGRVLRGLGL